MKYDDASWHYEGDFPEDLPHEAATTHIGMFLAWMLLNGQASEELREDAEEELAALQAREITGGQFLMRVLDEKLTDQEFDDLGNAFTVAYYQGAEDDSRYVDDYLEAFGVDVENLYGVPDSWEQYDRLAPLIDQRFATWNTQGRPEYVI